MAASISQGKTVDTTGTSTTITLSVAPTSGDTLLVTMRQGNTANLTGQTVTDSLSQTYTKIDDVSDNADTYSAFYAQNVSSTNPTVTLNAPSNGAGQTLRGTLEDATGVATTSVLRDHGTGTGTSTTASATTAGSTTQSGDLIWGYTGNPNGVTYTDTDTAGQAVPAAPSSKLATQWRVTGSGSVSTSFTLSTSQSWATGIATFVAASGGGATAVPPRMRTLRGAGV